MFKDLEEFFKRMRGRKGKESSGKKGEKKKDGKAGDKKKSGKAA
jgi:hypothetical protein